MRERVPIVETTAKANFFKTGELVVVTGTQPVDQAIGKSFASTYERILSSLADLLLRYYDFD